MKPWHWIAILGGGGLVLWLVLREKSHPVRTHMQREVDKARDKMVEAQKRVQQ